MGGMILIVDRRGAELELAGGGVLVLREPDRPPTRVGVRALSCVVLNGDIRLSTAVLRALAEQSVSLVALPLRGASVAATFTIASRRLAVLRHAQHLAYADPAARTAAARDIVAGKIAAQKRTLELCGAVEPLPDYEAALSRADSIQALMGVEGAVTREYFTRWGAAWIAPWSFNGRSRRPPLDPPNALMSLGYTLAQGLVERLAGRFGLDLNLGFLHGLHRDRNSLALDLLEDVRPVVDYWAWKLCRDGVVAPDEFTISASEGCRLSKDGRASVYRHWFTCGEPLLFAPVRHVLARLVARIRRFTSAVA